MFRSIAGERKQHDEDHRGCLLCNWGLLVVCMLVHLGRGQILSPMKSCWAQAIAMRFTDKEFASAQTSTVSGACSPVSGQKNVLFHMLQQRNWKSQEFQTKIRNPNISIYFQCWLTCLLGTCIDQVGTFFIFCQSDATCPFLPHMALLLGSTLKPALA